jgi:hypothetical protein
MSSFTTRTVVTSGDKSLLLDGSYAEPEITSMLTLTMRKGTLAGLKDPYSVILSESAAKALFGNADPVDKSLKLDNRISVKVRACTKTCRAIQASVTWPSLPPGACTPATTTGSGRTTGGRTGFAPTCN